MLVTWTWKNYKFIFRYKIILVWQTLLLFPTIKWCKLWHMVLFMWWLHITIVPVTKVQCGSHIIIMYYTDYPPWEHLDSGVWPLCLHKEIYHTPHRPVHIVRVLCTWWPSNVDLNRIWGMRIGQWVNHYTHDFLLALFLFSVSCLTPPSLLLAALLLPHLPHPLPGRTSSVSGRKWREHSYSPRLMWYVSRS